MEIFIKKIVHETLFWELNHDCQQERQNKSDQVSRDNFGATLSVIYSNIIHSPFTILNY